MRSYLKGGRYVIGRALGRGGFGVTYKAFDCKQYRAIVVIKECLLTDSGFVSRGRDKRNVVVDPSFREAYKKWLDRFYDEAQRISRFQHPNIVRIIDFFQENNTAYYVMPMVEGADLRAHLEKNGGKLSEREVLPLARSLISAIGALHAEGIIHRDIKPQNIILAKASQEPVLIDFGAARDQFSQEQSISHVGIQTDGYSPIEQVTASVKQGTWTDVYSLSATLYRCMAGRVPIAADKRYLNEGEDQLVPIETLVPNISSELARLINRGLAHNRKSRLQTMEEMLRILPSRSGSGDSGKKTSAWNVALSRAEIDDSSPAKTGMGFARERPMLLWLWFSPTIIASLGLYTADHPERYFSSALIWIAMFNFFAWLVVARTFRQRISDDKNRNHLLSIGAPTNGQEVPRPIGIVEFKDGEVAGKVVTLESGQSIVVGRSGDADVSIRNSHLSKRHVQITFRESDFEIEDLDSTNGTYLLSHRGNSKSIAIERIERYVGRGVFCLGPYDRERMRFECSLRRSADQSGHLFNVEK